MIIENIESFRSTDFSLVKGSVVSSLNTEHIVSVDVVRSVEKIKSGGWFNRKVECKQEIFYRHSMINGEEWLFKEDFLSAKKTTI